VQRQTSNQPRLPSVVSAMPMRRSASLCSVERGSALRCWQSTIKERLGTPGPSPPREALPGLLVPTVPNHRRSRSAVAPGAPGENDCRNSHVSMSSLGPSASVVAWFAQFRCEKCMRIPCSLEARFCFGCGEELPLPHFLGGGSDVGGSQVAAKKPPVPEKVQKVVRKVRLGNPSGALAACVAAARRDIAAEEGEKARAKGTAALNVPGKPAKPMRWKEKESQVAQWLGNIQPRR